MPRKTISNQDLFEALQLYAERTDERFNEINQRFTDFENILKSLATKQQLNRLLLTLESKELTTHYEIQRIRQ